MSEAKPSVRTRAEENVYPDSVSTLDRIERVVELVTVGRAQAVGSEVKVSIGPPSDEPAGFLSVQTIALSPEAARAFAGQIVEAADAAAGG